MRKAQIVKWGKGLAVRIPRAVAEQARLREAMRFRSKSWMDGSSCARPRAFQPWKNWWRRSLRRTVTERLIGDLPEVRKSLDGSGSLNRSSEALRHPLYLLRLSRRDAGATLGRAPLF
jgi:hypothetical protein